MFGVITIGIRTIFMKQTMKRYIFKGAAFIVAGAITFAVLAVLAVTNIWDVSKGTSFVLPLAIGLAAAFIVGKKAAS